MNVVDRDMDAHSPDPRSLAEAEDWFARLRTGNCTPRERVRFERWRAGADHAAAYAETERLWRGMDGLSGHPELQRLASEALRGTEPRHGMASRRRGWRLPVALAASLAACALLVAGYLQLRPPAAPPVEYATAAGQRETVVLEDGSRLTLNGDTALSVDYGRDARRLTLARGEAVFEVAHDARRPFRVRAGAGEVTALGTRFQVRNQPERVTVSLLEGSVSVRRQDTGERLRLDPGQQALLAAGETGIASRPVDVEVVSSWTRGRLLFRATPLAEVLEEVNRYAPIPLRLADPVLGGTPVSGTFPIGDGESVALGLQALLPIRAEIGADAIELRPRPEGR